MFAESDAAVFAKVMSEAESCKISAATFVEVAVVVEAQTKDRGSRQLDTFLRRAGFVIEPVTEDLPRHFPAHFGGFPQFGDC